MCGCIPHMFSYLWSPKEGISSSGAGVAGIYEQPDTDGWEPNSGRPAEL